MTHDVRAATWPIGSLGEALEALGREARLSCHIRVDLGDPPVEERLDHEALDCWIRAVTSTMDVDVDPVEVRLSDIDVFLARAGPALLVFPCDGEPRALAIVERARSSLRVVGPDLALRSIALDAVAATFRRPHEIPIEAEIDELLAQAGLRSTRQRAARARLVRERVGSIVVAGCWLLRLGTGRSFWQHFRHARLPRTLAAFLGTQILHDLLWALSWWMIGRGVLEGRLDWGWLVAWALLLLTLVPLQALATWTQAVLTVGTAGLLKLRLLAGALRTDPDEIRHQGIGHLVGRVLESEAVESLAQSGGILAVVAVIDLGIAATALGFGAGGPVHVLLLLGWLAIGMGVAWRYVLHRRSWTETRLQMTHELIERMVGHRTRLAQEDPGQRHEGEDRLLERYVDASRAMDRVAAVLEGLVPRGWLVLGLLWLGYRLLFSTGSLALALAGVLLARRAIARLALSTAQLSGAWIAWKQVASLAHAARRREADAPPAVAVARPAVPVPVLETRNVVFRYENRSTPALDGCDLRIEPGDRVLLLGASGSGKSTLVSILAGLRRPRSGLVLCHGLDRQSLGADAWRRRIALAPQFQENHIFAATLAFNLLMGRRWPPTPEDVDEAETVCRDLGLADLLARMPAGLHQLVGETGWQLSHGERSRVYIARALLQKADLVILDESFAELDPESLRHCVESVAKRAPSLLVITHR